MTRTKTLVIGMLVLTLLVFGLVALAGNGVGKGGYSEQSGTGIYAQERDSDGDGILNCNDPDWTRPLDGTGYGQGAQHRYGNGARAGSCAE